jgi:hypothetical protein
MPRDGALLPGHPQAPGSALRVFSLSWDQFEPQGENMPVILWLLGVPLGIVVLLMLFGVL